MSAYNPNAKTATEILGNVRFQLDNVEGYLMMASDRAETPTAAKIKAECLMTEARRLFFELQRECDMAVEVEGFTPLVVGQAWPATVEELYVQHRNSLLRPRQPKEIHRMSPAQIKRLHDYRRAFQERFELENGQSADAIRQRNNPQSSSAEFIQPQAEAQAA